MEIEAKVTGGEPVKVNFAMPETLEEAVERFGAEVIYKKAVDSLVIDVQALIRRHAKGTDKVPPKSVAEIQALVDAYTPGAARTRKTPVEKLGTMVSKLSDAEKAELLKQLRGE